MDQAPPTLMPALSAPGWHASLQLAYRREQGRTVSRHRHEGPLRVLQSLYPEGDAICHHVLVHPPGGLAGGDEVDIEAIVHEHAHALVTTPGATRYYRSAAGQASQRVRLVIESGARMEWLPLETIAYSGCQALNQVVVELAPGAEMMAWDVLALGLPASDLPFVAGHYRQHFEISGAWLDRGLIDATDRRLMDGVVGLAGRRCLGTLVWAGGSDLDQSRVDMALEQARAVPSESGCLVGVTCPHPRVVVARVLCDQTEPARQWLQAVWARWRKLAWQLQPQPSRMWQV